MYNICLSYLNHFISLFNSIPIMVNSKQIVKILFLCLPFAWFRATADGRVSTKFPTCIIDNFRVWLKVDTNWLLVRCVKLRKVTVSFVMSVCPSARTEQLGFHWTEFRDSWYLNIFRTSVKEIQVQRNSDKKHGSLIWWLVDIFFHFRSTSIVRGNISEKSSRGNKTHILLQKKFLQEIVAVKR